MVLNEFIDSLIKGDRKTCLKYVADYINENPDYLKLYEEVFKKSLYEVGEMWEYNKITVATEHLATSITESLLNHIYTDMKFLNNTGKRIIVACTEKEEHQVGIKMVADVFESNGWETFFLGANIPAGELILFIDSIKPDLLALSLSIYFNLPNLEKMVKLIRERFPDLPIIIGGQAFRYGGKDILLNYDNVKFIPDLYSLELFIKDDAVKG
jgi:methanogenic corrinoid protein MtbC1